MTMMYSTITSKGQITLPAEARRALGLHAGQKVAVHIEDDRLVIDRPDDISTLRARIRSEAERRGTWGTVPHSGDGWAARAQDHPVRDDDAQS
ncbi:AbrB/MazE/SpoVT family DNA-binding domain-containing protein [Acidipropionibacterium virtanenii]|uniref:SpoVT-AbrB domain-containing protein n=1 Tax=Acidipropionibacterium virtanenii TaxID=2057246 RepID=A0A344UUW7_9ACTN|nr:AbrB/MazE/SpoVT family DNA-binding domain-containing protein [Acidipropionibacterium virtanenii]AXE39065.1 hypothetical protein JS278_01909 [Acidipropionibacterium virtanenii]